MVCTSGVALDSGIFSAKSNISTPASKSRTKLPRWTPRPLDHGSISFRLQLTETKVSIICIASSRLNTYYKKKFVIFSNFLLAYSDTAISYIYSTDIIRYPLLRDFVELEDDLTRHLGGAHVRASVCVTRGHLCIRECVPYLPRERKRDTSSMRRGKERGGRIDIKIVTEFRRAATYPNALDSPLNYPFSSRILLTLPLPSPPFRLSMKPRSHFTLSGLFFETYARFAIDPRNFSSQPAGRKTPS